MNMRRFVVWAVVSMSGCTPPPGLPEPVPPAEADHAGLDTSVLATWERQAASVVDRCTFWERRAHAPTHGERERGAARRRAEEACSRNEDRRRCPLWPKLPGPERCSEPPCVTPWPRERHCPAVEPEDPIATERVYVRFTVPPPRGEPWCAPLTGAVDRASPDRFVVRLGASAAPCERPRRGPAEYVVDLGVRPAGTYTVVTPSGDHTIRVREAGAPAVVLVEERIRFAVAKRLRPRVCFGMPSPSAGRSSAVPWEQSRARRIVEAIHPELPEPEQRALVLAAMRIELRPDGPGRFHYAYVDGQCCWVDEVRGEVTIDEAGTIVVGPPFVLRRQQRPC